MTAATWPAGGRRVSAIRAVGSCAWWWGWSYYGSISGVRTQKISVSVSDEDVRFVEGELRAGRFPSRSAAVAAGLRLLRESALVDSYAEAFAQWHASGEAEAWETVAGDGLGR